MLVGYARVSTAEQEAGFEAQQRDLANVGCEKMFIEKRSSVDANRVELERALDFVREGDTFVCTKIDRLARSVIDLNKIVQRLEGKKVGLRVLAIGLDTTTPTGRLMLNMLGSIAQFEREIMLERQREGIARAKADGKYKGRPVSIDGDAIRKMKAEGLTPTQIVRQAGVSRSTVYRALEEADQAP